MRWRARRRSDAVLKELITEVYETNFLVYGARKVWRELHRQGHEVARCTVERLMRELGITGAVRGKKVITTIPDGSVERGPDLLDRKFVASAPNRCWVADFTYVKTWSGIVYVAFVVDTFSRRITGWSASHSKETQLILDALEMVLRQRDREGRPPRPGELIHHSDAGSQGGFKWSSQHLDGSCDEHSKTAVGSFWAGALVLTRSTAGGRARGAAAILGSDCGGHGE
jgi:putative transposase